MTKKCYNKLCITNQYYLYGLKYQKGKLSKMNTILPSYFVFSRANSIYQEPTRHVIPDQLGFIISISLFVLFFVTSSMLKKKKHTHWILIPTAFLIAFVVFGCWIYPVSKDKYASQKQEYSSQGFKIANTNLVALPDKYSYHKCVKPIFVIKNKKVDQAAKVKRDQYAIYVNTNRSDINMVKGNTNKILLDDDKLLPGVSYLGMMKQGKFKPANTKTSTIFVAYQKYIVKNHLENYFKKQMSFVKSNEYLTNNYEPSLVLIGDHNYTLHLAQNETIDSKLATGKIVAN